MPNGLVMNKTVHGNYTGTIGEDSSSTGSGSTKAQV